MAAVMFVIYIPSDKSQESETNLAAEKSKSAGDVSKLEEKLTEIASDQDKMTPGGDKANKAIASIVPIAEPEEEFKKGEEDKAVEKLTKKVQEKKRAEELEKIIDKFDDDESGDKEKLLPNEEEEEVEKTKENTELPDSFDESNMTNMTNFSLEEALQAFLEHLEITNDIWVKTDDKNSLQVSFTVEFSDTDVTLKKLVKFGVGRIPETSISIFPASVHFKGCSEDNIQAEEAVVQQSETEEFVKSVKSRLTVAQVVDGVGKSAKLTFDFIILIILASLIAGLGLAENSSVILVASMLVSPLMGPIMGGTFGLVIHNNSLIRLGIRNEAIGLTLCLLCGFILGLLISAVNLHGAGWGSTPQWPTSEMASRGQLRSLWVGVLIAIPSGAGVALSLLGGNAGSLVGVAISASLLPPMVNSGMLWAYALITEIRSPDVNTTIIINGCPKLIGNDYVFTYHCKMGHEAGVLGVVSLLLTLLNIVCIFAMGIVVLKIKEVAPHTAISESTDIFWKRDIKVAREAYKTLRGKESENLVKSFRLWQDKSKGTLAGRRVHSLDNIINNIETDTYYNDIASRVPGGYHRPAIQPLSRQQSEDEYYHTARGLSRSSLEDGTIGYSNLRLEQLRLPYFPHTPRTPRTPMDSTPGFVVAPTSPQSEHFVYPTFRAQNKWKRLPRSEYPRHRGKMLPQVRETKGRFEIHPVLYEQKE